MAGRARKPLRRVSGFWDTSALIPLCVRQSMTPRAIALYENHDVIVWWGTPVEIASALARLVRMRQIDTSDRAKARELANNLAESWSVIQPSDSLRNRATRLVELYDLRAADALQLAAALDWCENVPQNRIFLTTDRRLQQAALLSGFDAKQM